MTDTTGHAEHEPRTTTDATNEPATREPIAYTIREAADLAGMSRAAMRGRVERQSLRSVLGRDGKRRVPRSELERAGLLDHARNLDEPHGWQGVALPRPATHDMAGFLQMLRELQAANVAAIERAVVAEQRLQLEQRTASTMEDAYHAERLRADHLQSELTAALARRRSWFQRRRESV